MLRIFEQSADVLAIILGAIWAHFVPTIDSGKTVNYNSQRNWRVRFISGGVLCRMWEIWLIYDCGSEVLRFES